MNRIIEPHILKDNAFTCLESLSKHIEPPIDLLPSDFSRKYISLPSDNAKPGSFVPFSYQVEPMNAMADPLVRILSLMWSAQSGKSQLFLNGICYYIYVRPSNIILLLPTADDVSTMKTTKLDPLLATTRGVRDRVSKPRSRIGRNNNSIVTFTGGNIFFSSANAARTMKSRSVPIVMLDEISNFPVDTGEGSPISLVKQRTKTFGDRKKIIQTSTPTITGDAIHHEFLQGDQRYFYVPCPHCGESQTLDFKNMIIPKDKDKETGDIIKWYPEDAYYAGKCCGTVWTDVDKIKAVKKGEWIATKESRGHRSYQLSEMYSPLLRWKDTAVAYVDARAKYDLQSFYNNNLGLPWEEEAVKVDASALAVRATRFDENSIPEKVVMLTTGTDVQKDRIETQLVGWGKHEDSYVIEHTVFWGDTAQSDVWDQCREYLGRQYTHSSGIVMRSTINLVDSGYLSPNVYAFCQKTPKTFPCKGASNRLQSLYSRSSSNKMGKKLINIDTISAKMMLNSRVNIVNESNEAEIHFSDTLDNEWYLQFTAEKMIKKRLKGRIQFDFKKIRSRNEALDCYLYAYIAMKLAAPKGMGMRHKSFYRNIDNNNFTAKENKREEKEIQEDPYTPVSRPAKKQVRSRNKRRRPTPGFWK